MLSSLSSTNEDDYDEMICKSCMCKNKFLWYYQGYLKCLSLLNVVSFININQLTKHE